jgi:two-component system, OmpR family, sensor kinase
MAETVVSEFGAVAGDHTLEVESEGDPHGEGDEQRVLQIGRILVENALRHTPPGTRVVVRAERRPDGAALVVEDDGPGIPREHAGHVFERFYRIEGGLASGSGLGLAIGRELAQVMGGRLELESRPGRTVFTLWLAAPAAVAAEPRPREREPVPT